MINLKLIRAAGSDPRENLALEATLMEQCKPGEMILYLWQNDHTVVIGRNQNPWKECNMTQIEKDGVTLVRRPSGGGAVYHDLGNLNFTFLTEDAFFSKERQAQVVCDALATLGITAQFSGRNDLLVEGKKFSGNAYHHSKGFSSQHGTLLIDSNLTMMPRYLNPDPEKLKAKGVDSVRSRVTNLKVFQPGLTVGQVADALVRACEREYNSIASPIDSVDTQRVAEWTKHFSDPKWTLGVQSNFDISWAHRFSWGDITLELDVHEGVIQDVRIYSDAMDTQWIETIKDCLKGCPYSVGAMTDSLQHLAKDEQTIELIDWIQAQET